MTQEVKVEVDTAWAGWWIAFGLVMAASVPFCDWNGKASCFEHYLKAAFDYEIEGVDYGESVDSSARKNR